MKTSSMVQSSVVTGLVGNDVTTFIRDNLVSIDMSYVRTRIAGQRHLIVEPVFS